MSTIIIGGGSGLGAEIFKELSKINKVYCFSSKKKTYINLINLDIQKFKKSINQIKEIKEAYFLCNLSKHQAFLNISKQNLEKYVKFNFLNFSLIIQALIKKNNAIHIKLILSHINFMFNRGFSIYRSQKIFQKTLLDNLQIENKKLLVSYFYPGSMKTNFSKNNNYNGISFFNKQDANEVAKKIIDGKKFSKFSDFILYIIYNLLPNVVIINIYKIIIDFLNKK